MKRFFFALLAIIVLVGIASAASRISDTTRTDQSRISDGTEYKKAQVTARGGVFDAYVSDTEALRAQGLSVFSSLKENEAMLFVFSNPAQWGFWMKDMKFSIDIVWIDAESRIVSIEKDVAPRTYPKTFFPKTNALYVLEFSAGTAERVGMREGDRVEIDFFE